MDELAIIGIIVFIPLAILGLLFSGRGDTPPITDADGEVVNDSIAKLERVELGDFEQYVLMRGVNKLNPVLLWLHGGPGAAQMPLAHEYDTELEEDFVVVHWDQRGAGKSNPIDLNETTINIDQILSDAHELTEFLQDKFDQEQIYLLGFSWGSFLGMQLVDEHPEDYVKYIGMSQIVDGRRTHEVAYEWLRNRIDEDNNERDMDKLMEMGQPPFLEDYDNFVQFSRLVSDYGGNFDVGFDKLYRTGISAPEYRLVDFRRWMKGYARGGRPFWDERDFEELSLIEEIPEVDVPVHFLHGKDDYMTPLEPVEDYYESIEAPEKNITVFNESAHTPFLGEHEKFLEIMSEIKR